MEAFSLDSLGIGDLGTLPTVDSSPLYEFTGIDPRILNLSYSGNLTLHACPRRFQLSRLNAEKQIVESIDSKITFSYGHVVGHGLQLYLEGKSEEEIIWTMFLEWEVDLFDSNDKQQKSFWRAVAAVQRFISMCQFGYLDEWELVYHEGKPAVELSFVVLLPNGFRYRGSVDAVLRNKVSGEVRVLECKTSSATNLNPAEYKNSAQAIGYSVVLDSLFPDLSSYEVLYLVYLTKKMEWEQLLFPKSYLQRALWIQELLLDCEVIMLYENTGVYPMRGESCNDWFRECEFMQTCTLSTAHITSPLTQQEYEVLQEREAQWQIKVTVEDLIQSQLARS